MERTDCLKTDGDVVFTIKHGIYGKREGRESIIGSFVAPNGKIFRYTPSTRRKARQMYLEYCKTH